MPVHPTHYRPCPVHAELGEAFFDAVEPADFPEGTIRFRNDLAANDVGLDTLSDDEWTCHFREFDPLPDNLPQPLALRYHGHQFRSYNPDIGDGRGFLFAQLKDRSGRILDLGTKGSGTTPYSRSGDGRLTLKGAVRELLATEMLEALRVPTSRTFSIVETGERLWRGDEPSPTRSAVLVRLQHSHIRIGTFQRLAFEGNGEAIRRLVRHCGEHYGIADGDPVRFLRDVVARVARMGADWWAAGFVHGVLNTDNIVVTGDSFDYGPWRFLERYDPTKVAAYFDHSGLYAFGRQPEALSWNLERLAECLLFAFEDARDALTEALSTFSSEFDAALIRRTHERLGIVPDDADAARERVRLLYAAMRSCEEDYQQIFADLGSLLRTGSLPEGREHVRYDTDGWNEALTALRSARAIELPAGTSDTVVNMSLDAVESVWAAIAQEDDWRPLAELRERVRKMGAREAVLASGLAATSTQREG